MAYRVTILINHASGKQRFAGWSDTFYSAAATIAGAISQTNELAEKINQAMGNHSVPVAMRFTELSPLANQIVKGKRLVQVHRFNFTAPGLGTSAPSATPEKALLIRDWGTGGVSRMWWLNGIPDGQETNGGDYTPTGDYGARFQAIVDVLAAPLNLWRLRVQDRTIEPRVITNFTVNGIVTTLGAHGYADNDIVHVVGYFYDKDVPPRDRISGKWKIIVLTPTTFNLGLDQDQVLSIDVQGQGKVYKEQLVLAQYAAIAPAIPSTQVIRGGSHAVGAPFDPHTGRRTR